MIAFQHVVQSCLSMWVKGRMINGHDGLEMGADAEVHDAKALNST